MSDADIATLEQESRQMRARMERLEAENAMKWINPNDKTQARYLPNIGEAVLFSHGGKVYLGKHTGGCFKAMTPPFAIFETWDCRWMYVPAAIDSAKGGAA